MVLLGFSAFAFICSFSAGVDSKQLPITVFATSILMILSFWLSFRLPLIKEELENINKKIFNPRDFNLKLLTNLF